jgi:hypothetical protein
MNFIDPISFDEALAAARERDTLPTNLSSAQIQEWSRELRARSFFIARANNAEFVQDVQAVFDELLQGNLNIAKARELIQRTADALGYEPEAGGFPGLKDPNIPPALRGTLRDLSSKKRIDLTLDTQLRLMTSIGMKVRGSTPQALYTYPCWELVRVYPRITPRGLKRGKGGAVVPDPDNAWPARWQKAGGTLHGGRMVARKDDQIWAALGSSGNFRDALDTDHPPFAFNSGYAWRELRREDAIALGVITEDDRVAAPASSTHLDDVKASAVPFSPEILKELKALGAEVENGKLQLAKESAAARALYLGNARTGNSSTRFQKLRSRVAGILQGLEAAA